MPYTHDAAELCRRRRGDRRRADRRPDVRPARHTVRPPCDPSRKLHARPAPRGEGRLVVGAARRRLRRRTGGAVRSGSLARGDRGDGRARCSPPARSRSCSAATTRSPSLTCGPVPRLTARSRSSTSTRTPTPARRCSASRSRTGRPCTGWSSRATSIRRRYVQIGLRGYWPGEQEFAWQAERGITSFFMHDVRDLGIREVVRRTLGARRARPRVPDRRRGRARPGVRTRNRARPSPAA